MPRCEAEFVSSNPSHPTLTCGKSRRFHLWHRDPATGVRYTPSSGGIFCLCGLLRHRKHCPLRDLS